MSDHQVIKAHNISKVYKLYERPIDRLKEAVYPFGKKFHRDFYALRNVDIAVQKGESVGIIGKNGSGKSTLLKIITGIIPPSSGTISVAGRISALLELGAGFNPELSGVENVFFSGTLMGYGKEEMVERLPGILAFADIGDYVHQPVKTYSSGMFMRLAFAVAISVEPDILVVDEALAVGDSQFQKKCLDAFYRHREQGCTILFVSHDSYTVRNFCQKALYLRHGEVAFWGSSEEAVENYIFDQEKESAAKMEKQPEVALTHQIQDDGRVTILDVRFENSHGDVVENIRTGEDVCLRFRYRTNGHFDEKISFVFNLYRHDDFYVCGTTTIMDGYESLRPGNAGEVAVRFPRFRLLSGRYKWRVAINDAGGLGVLAEAVPVCPFKVVDNFESVGIIDLEREWQLPEGY